MWPFKSNVEEVEPEPSLPGQPLPALEPVIDVPKCRWKKGQFVVCDGHVGVFVGAIAAPTDIGVCLANAMVLHRKHALCDAAQRLGELVTAKASAAMIGDGDAELELVGDIAEAMKVPLYEVHKIDLNGETAIQCIVTGDQITRLAQYLEIPEFRRGDRETAAMQGYL